MIADETRRERLHEKMMARRLRHLVLAALAATACSEAEKKPTISLPKHGCLGDVLHAFTLLDANGDGMLSREEVNLAITTSRAAPSEGGATEITAPDAALTMALQEYARMRAENEVLAGQLAAGRACDGNHDHSKAHGDHTAAHK